MALAVGLGAFGAHALKPRLELFESVETWRTAVTYQAWHALALILLGVVTLVGREPLPLKAGSRVGYLFLIGSILFSGSLYLLSTQPSATWAGPVTPLGGLLLIFGWLGFARLAGAASTPKSGD
jgi:uncharacterized membrane protein YgdD (TMEM256/DUF423 family)